MPKKNKIYIKIQRLFATLRVTVWVARFINQNCHSERSEESYLSGGNIL